jgi:DNA-binding response OmpR family regulator
MAKKSQRYVVISMEDSPCVLIVEDDEFIAMLIAEALKDDMNVRTLILHNGSDAIRFLADQHVDLLILDYQLPGANGIEVYEAMRLSARTAHTPVLFITANDKRADFQRRGLTYIRKPFNLFELLATVETHLNKRASVAST